MSKQKFKDYLKVHIDIPSLIVILLILFIFWRKLTIIIFNSCEFIYQEVNPPEWVKNIGLGIVSNILSAAILIFIGYLYFKLKTKPFFAGNFTAYEITKNTGAADTETEWGNLTLTYNIFSKRIKGILRSKDNQVCITLSGEFDKDRYLRGTYIEKDNPSRLRLGAFLMLLSPNGDNYEGSFMHLSPSTGFDKPELGFAKWIKK